jgi:hypothetical protein
MIQNNGVARLSKKSPGNAAIPVALELPRNLDAVIRRAENIAAAMLKPIRTIVIARLPRVSDFTLMPSL